MEPIRVLHINAGSGIYGGVSSFCLNIYRNIRREKVQFDFLTPNQTTYGDYREEIKRYGGHVYDLGINAKTLKGKLRFHQALKTFLSEHSYDIIHINAGVLLFNCVAADACKRYSQAKVFVHSHSNGGRSAVKEALSEPLKMMLAKRADCLLACSESAANYMFPRDKAASAIILNNGIHVQSFAFDPLTRDEVRKQLGIENSYVVGHVGRFTAEKNHAFLLEVFAKVKQKKSESVLLLIGEGPLMNEMKTKANQLGIAQSVIFTGARNDVNRLYQAMDVFVLPSVFEGFGIVNIEAQTAGLQCITSTAVPAEVDVTGNVVRISLEQPETVWAEEILKESKPRRDCSKEVRDSGFDMAASAERLEHLYEEVMCHE